MPDFITMQRCQHQYQDAATKADRLRQRIENMKSALASGVGGADLLERLEAAEKEYKAAEVEMDDLYCLATYGKHRKELDQGQGIRHVQQFGGHKPHYPPTPSFKLPH